MRFLPRYSARRFAAIAVLIALLAGSLSVPVSQAASSSGTATPIKHLIIITMENHSFDNIFGKYPYDPAAHNQTLVSEIQRPHNLMSGGISSGLSAVPNGTFSTGNPQEGYSSYHIDWNHGKMNGFLNGSGPNSMKYFTASQMGIEWMLAQEFSMGDMYFSSALSETYPNRLYQIAGFSPVMNDYGPPPYIPFDQTVFGQLASSGVSWGYYINNTHLGTSPLTVIRGMGSYSSHIGTWGSFYSELSNNTLPSVSWLMPINGGAEQYSQHPSYNVLIGELWLLFTINRIMQSPEWNSTAVMINYDEGGGYYDQTPPPAVAGHQLGIRVPFFLISPYAKEDYVSSTVMSHTSTIAFIDYNWKLPALNTLVQKSGIPLDLFNFDQIYPGNYVVRQPLNLSSKIRSLIPPSYNFGPSAYSNISSLAGIFPMKFQIPVSELPYRQNGSSSMTLSSLGMPVQFEQNFQIIPWYESSYFIAGVLLAGSASLYYLYRRSAK